MQANTIGVRSSRLLGFIIVLISEGLLIAGIRLSPEPYRWIVVAQIAAPWLAFALASPLLKAIKFRYAWENKYVAWMGCAFVIAAPAKLAYIYVGLVNSRPLVLIACSVGLIFCAVGVFLDRQLRKDLVAIVLWAAALILYSYVAIFQLNCVLDKSAATIRQPSVIKKSLAFGYLYHSHYELLLQPWGSDHHIANAAVPRRLYVGANPGDTVCVVEREGWLGMRWYTVQPRSWNGGPVFLGRVRGSQ
jgi:hypothetical protein